MNTPKPPKFQRPNPEGAKSKSKIYRVGTRIIKLLATVESAEGRFARGINATGTIEWFALPCLTSAKDGDEAKFNAAYQRHLRKLDADKIKHPKK